MQDLGNATASGVTLSLGMLGLVVSVHAAVGEDDSGGLKMVCTDKHAPTPVKQRLACPVCDNAERGTFQRARPVGDGYVVIPPEVLDQVKTAADAFKKQITLTVHPATEVTSVLLPSGKSYYLNLGKGPSQGMRDTYTLLGQLVRSRADLAFMTKYTLRSATSVFRLVVAGDGTLVLQQMADAALVRKHPQIEFSELDGKALDLANMLAETQTTPFLAAEHGSGKTSIIADYANAQNPLQAAAVAAGPVVGELDIVAQLQAAIEAQQPKRATRRKRATAA